MRPDVSREKGGDVRDNAWYRRCQPVDLSPCGVFLRSMPHERWQACPFPSRRSSLGRVGSTRDDVGAECWSYTLHLHLGAVHRTAGLKHHVLGLHRRECGLRGEAADGHSKWRHGDFATHRVLRRVRDSEVPGVDPELVHRLHRHIARRSSCDMRSHSSAGESFSRRENCGVLRRHLHVLHHHPWHSRGLFFGCLWCVFSTTSPCRCKRSCSTIFTMALA
mmetsp:Transcript_28551/g.39761  ORF Transcript_28551/g.39761 Transcript_28551/m.39761 type:complete len:220 (+) Transcript_28551:641-1300(+)